MVYAGKNMFFNILLFTGFLVVKRLKIRKLKHIKPIPKNTKECAEFHSANYKFVNSF
jgi:hypothetical protein